MPCLRLASAPISDGGRGQVKMRATDLYQVDTFRLYTRSPSDDDGVGHPAPSGWVWPADDEAWRRVLQGATRACAGGVGRAARAFRGASKVWQSMLHQTGEFNLKGEGLHGCPQWRSALEIIVHYEVEAFVNDPLVNK